MKAVPPIAPRWASENERRLGKRQATIQLATMTTGTSTSHGAQLRQAARNEIGQCAVHLTNSRRHVDRFGATSARQHIGGGPRHRRDRYARRCCCDWISCSDELHVLRTAE